MGPRMMSHSGKRPITVKSLFNSTSVPARSPVTYFKTAICDGSDTPWSSEQRVDDLLNHRSAFLPYGGRVYNIGNCTAGGRRAPCRPNAPQPIQLPDHEHIAVAEASDRLGQAGMVGF